MLIERTPKISKLEIARVSDNWRSHSNSRFLEFLGGALMWATDEQAQIIKDGFTEDWDQWNGDFDETGRRLVETVYIDNGLVSMGGYKR